MKNFSRVYEITNPKRPELTKYELEIQVKERSPIPSEKKRVLLRKKRKKKN